MARKIRWGDHQAVRGEGKSDYPANSSAYPSSMVYVEGEASMRKFQREGGEEQQALSIVQRRSF